MSQSSVTRLLKQLKSLDNTKVSEQSDEQSDEQSIEQSDQQSEQSSHDDSQESDQSEEEQKDQSEEEELEIQNEQSQMTTIEQQVQDEQEQVLDQSLINYINQKANDSIPITKNRNEWRKKSIQIKEPKEQEQQPQRMSQVNQQKQQQPLIIQQVDLQTQEQDQDQIKCFMIKIRKLIQYFSTEPCIQHIIGSNEQQQLQFTQRLYLKNLEEIKLIHKTLEFELLFSRSNSFIQDSIHHGAIFVEKSLQVIGIDVVGVYDELQEDQEYQFYMKMLLCDTSYVPSAKQILFMKFIKSYYSKFNGQQQQQKLTNSEVKKQSEGKISSSILDKFNNL